jgi:hypothetical protein
MPRKPLYNILYGVLAVSLFVSNNSDIFSYVTPIRRKGEKAEYFFSFRFREKEEPGDEDCGLFEAFFSERPGDTGSFILSGMRPRVQPVPEPEHMGF